MEKKIIAIALVLVLMVTAFVGCGKNHNKMNIGGKEVLLETDAEGSTLIKDDKLVAIVTDNAGEIITHENGENQTYYINIPGSLVIDGITHGEHYKLKLLKGWTATDFNKVYKDGTDGKCYIDCVMALSKFEEGEDIDTYLEKIDTQDETVIKVFSDEKAMAELVKDNPAVEKFNGCKYEVTKSNASITKDNLSCRVRIHKAVDKNGDLIHYVESYYFVSGESLYTLSYTCEDGKGYDKTFDFKSYVNQNFTFVK